MVLTRVGFGIVGHAAGRGGLRRGAAGAGVLLAGAAARRAASTRAGQGYKLIVPQAPASFGATAARGRSTMAEESFESREQQLVQTFVEDVRAHLAKDGKGVAVATAWLVTDNVMVSLFQKHTPEVWEKLSIVGVDTLHLFEGTYQVAEAVQTKYGKRATITKPTDCLNREDFVELYGDCEQMDHGDFDMHSKIEPFNRALQEVGREQLVTGRRMDQGEKRTVLAVYEPEAKIFNPMAGWSWDDITAYADKHSVPCNPEHNLAFRAEAPIPATERHLQGLPWTVVDLGRPFWQCTPEEIAGGAKHAYINKSFGDVHTTVPVYPHESERTGRFVRTNKTECGIHTRAVHKGSPHGGALVDLMVADEAEKAALVAACTVTVDLTERQACDVELLMIGGFSPLRGFMDETTYTSVVEKMRLPEEQLFGLPVTLDVPAAHGAAVGDKVLLRAEGQDVAVLEVESVYKPDKVKEAFHCFGTSSLEHPGVASLATENGPVYLGGPVRGLARPAREWHHPSPAEVREMLPEGKDVVAFQNRNPIHKAHYELIRRAPSAVPNSVVLVHPTCGPTQPGDIESDVRIHTYKALEAEVQNKDLVWAYLPYSMKMAGPREAIQHMIIRKNFGATHFIIGRDMAGTKSTIDSEDFYGAYDAQEMGEKHAAELGMEVVTFENVVYTEENGYMLESEAKAAGLKKKKLSGTEFRRMLRAGEDIPEWFAFKSVIDVLRGGSGGVAK